MYKRSVAEDLSFLLEHGVEFDYENPLQEMYDNARRAIRHFGMSHTSAATFTGSLRRFLKAKAKSVGVRPPEGRKKQRRA